MLQANRFLEAGAVRGLSVSTLRAYAFDLAWLLVWLHGCASRVGDLDQAKLLDFVAAQRERGAQPSSINRRLTVAALFFRFTTGCELPRGVGASVPGAHYRGRGREHELGLHAMPRHRRLQLRVRAPHKLVEPLSASQVTSFLDRIKRYRDLAIVYLMLFCGLRSAEVLALRLGDFDAAEGRGVRVSGKGNKQRVLPLPASLPGIVADYLRLERPASAATDRLFVVLQGAPSRSGDERRGAAKPLSSAPYRCSRSA
jgi:site-specific recombinase XerD